MRAMTHRASSLFHELVLPLGLALGAASCASPEDFAPSEDEPTPSSSDDDEVDEEEDEDTGDTDYWDTGGPDDTDPPVDTGDPPNPGSGVCDGPPLGPDPRDGTYVGTFTLVDVVPAMADPVCSSDVEITVDGTQQGQILATLTCTGWDPDLLGGFLGGGHGPLNGFLLGTLDPSDTTRGETCVTLSTTASNPLADEQGVAVQFDGDTLTIDMDTVSGIGPLKVGQRLNLTATRQ